jgi:hypothetical protein
MKSQVSRLWVRRYEQPRDDDGKFLAGAFIYTRFDGSHRFLRHQWDPIEEDLAHHLHATNQLRRFLQIMAVVIAVAVFLYVKGWA